jgi:TonB family protein
MKIHLVIALLPFITFSVNAQTKLSTDTLSFKEAMLVNDVRPEYPFIGRQADNEAVVVISYVIQDDGAVVDPVIEYSSGSKLFENEALKALQERKYRPATYGGKPVIQSVEDEKFVFQKPASHPDNTDFGASFAAESCRSYSGMSSMGGYGESTGFACDGGYSRMPRYKFGLGKKYSKIMKLINHGKIEKAEKNISKITKQSRKRLRDDQLYWLLKTNFYIATKNEKELLNSLENVAVLGSEYTGAETYLSVLQDMYTLRVKSGRFRAALDTYNVIADTKDSTQILFDIEESKRKVEELIESEKPVSIHAGIENKEFWRHRLMRNRFAISDIDGNLDKIDIRCKYHRQVVTINESNVYDIYNSVNACTIYVYGKTGSRFTLHELPINEPNESS